MMYLQRALDWAKQNPLTVGAVAVVVLCLILWPVMVLRPGADFRQKVQTDANTHLRQIDQYLSRTVTLPPRTADGTGESVSMVINSSAIERRGWINRRVNDEYRAIFEQAMAFNAAGHQPMIDGLFPRPVDESRPVLARERYLQSFRSMLEEYRPEAALPRLNAGTPPSTAEINEEIVKAEQEFAAEFGSAALTSTSPEMVEALRERRQQRVKELLVRRARSIHIYAETSPTGLSPFDIDGWASQASIPSMEALWESQLSLWIQQDIVEAIARTNRVDNPTYDVTMMPVKRLVKIDVLDGYVGIDTSGGIAGQGAASVARGGARSRGGSAAGGTFGGMTMEQMMAGALPPPPDMDGGVRPPPADGGPSTSAAEPQVEQTITPLDLPARDYTVGHTGRICTQFYDVRHAWLTVVVDSARLPQMLDNLARVNFMTVLKVIVVDVDEYEALREGYVYGSGDAVEANILIETVWLRHWTNDLMPFTVRQRIGAVDLEPASADSAG